jgi:hypothetical protein
MRYLNSSLEGNILSASSSPAWDRDVKVITRMRRHFALHDRNPMILPHKELANSA